MRPSAAAAVLAALVVVVAGCGGSKRPFTVGIVTDCEGVFAPFSPNILAGAELPLLERGAKLAGRGPTDGVDRSRVGGRRVRVVQGCAEITFLTQLIENVRRLIEVDRVDVVVAPLLGQSEGVLLVRLARRYPETTFVLANTYAQEPTLRNPAPNVFRVTADGAQLTAGLGAYAYHHLGWRTAAVVLPNDSYSWPEAAGFVAEFCTLGGRVARVTMPNHAAGAVRRLPRDADGVALISRSFAETSAFGSAYAKIKARLARHLVLGPGSFDFADPRFVANTGSLLRGVVLGGWSHDAHNPAWAAFQRAYRLHFPGLPVLRSPADASLTVGYYDAVEAVALALERAPGGGRPFRHALATMSFNAPNGPLHLDRDRQAVVSATLSRFQMTRHGPAIRTLRVLGGVEQTFAGYFGPRTPTPTVSRPGCHPGAVPPWAR
jgi:branched-chain amino acid transport system substrate-binding protein